MYTLTNMQLHIDQLYYIRTQARTQTFKKGGSKFLIRMDFRYRTGTKLLIKMDFRYKTGEGGGKISSHRDSHRGLLLHL